MDGKERATWWQSTEHLTALFLGAAFLLCVLPLLAPRDSRAFGLAMDDFVAAIVVPVLAAILVFLHAWRQRQLDRKHRGAFD